MILYSIKDKQVGFMAPQVFPSDGAAARALANEVKSGRSVIAQNPEDFAMYRVGEFDENSGFLRTVEPFILCEASTFDKEKEEA